MRHLLAVVLGSLFAVGCVGAVGEEGTGGDDGVDPNPTAKMGQKTYIRDVHPIMSRCSGGACHSVGASSGALGKFYEVDGAAGYAKIVVAPTIIGEGAQAFASIAPILTKIQTGHQGITYSSDDTTKISGWLAIELEEHKDNTNPNPTPVVNPKEVLKTFSGCLTIADFNTAQMAQKWSTLAASNNQKCLNCHQAGGDGFIVNANADLFFKVMSENSAYMLKFFSVDTASTPAKVVVNTGSFTNAGVTIAGHPRFDPLNNQGMVALKAFYDLAAAKQAAGTCSPTPTIKD
jgi:hypothetical protein